jgi:hypothetical protein
MTLAVVGQARLLPDAKKSLEAIADSLAQPREAGVASSKSNHWWLSHLDGGAEGCLIGKTF